MTATHHRASTALAQGVWVCVVTEIPLAPDTLDADISFRAEIVDVVTFPADTARDTQAAQRWQSDNNFLDLSRRVIRQCQLRHCRVICGES